VANNPIAYSKMNHVKLHDQYLKKLLQENVVSIVYCKTYNQITNIFMKTLKKVKFCNDQQIHRQYNITITTLWH
jgi:hypothetical protein